jgi:hypothetical protein
MTDSMDAAVTYKNQHPSESYASVSDRFNIPKSTLHNRHKHTHLDHVPVARRQLSIAQEGQLLNQINRYASRDTLLTPGHITELAEAIHGARLGQNWTTRFIR